MKNIKMIVLVLVLMLVASVANGIVVTVTSDSTQSVVLSPAGVQQSVFEFQIQNTEVYPVFIQTISLSWNNENYQPMPIVECTLFGDGATIGTTSIYEMDFPFGQNIGGGQVVDFLVLAYASQYTEIGSEFRLSIGGFYPGLPVTVVGHYGPLCIVGGGIDISAPMARIYSYPERQPTTEVWSNGSTYTTDTFYLFPGQWMNYDTGLILTSNSCPNSIVAMDVTSNVSTCFGPDQLSINWCWPGLNWLDEVGTLYADNDNLTWVSDSTVGISNTGIKCFTVWNNNNLPGEVGAFFTSIQATFNIPGTITTQGFWTYVHLVNNQAIRFDLNGDGLVNHDDVAIGIRQWSNQDTLWSTQYNPDGQINIARQQGLPFNGISTANIWFGNAWLSDPDNSLFNGYGIGEPFTVSQPHQYTYSNENGLVTVNTDGNAASVVYRRSDGTFGGQDLVNQGATSLFFRSEAGINPEQIQSNRDGQFVFQLPVGATLVSVDATVWPTLVGTSDNTAPGAEVVLGDNYPNPFNPSTTISYSLTKPSLVKIEVFNVKGQLVKQLVNQTETSGQHQVVWNGKDNNNAPASSGVYFYKMTAGGHSTTKKMMLIK